MSSAKKQLDPNQQAASVDIRQKYDSLISIFEHATEGIFQTTLEGKYLSLNPAIATMLEYNSIDDMIEKTHGLSTEVYAHPEDRQKVTALIRQNGVIKDYEVQMRKRDGTHIWISMNAYNVKNKKGEILYLEGTLRDVSDRKRAEEKLQRSEAKFRTIVENSFEGIAFCDATGKVFYRSPTYVKIDGYCDEERIGHSGFEKVHPDDLNKVKTLWRQIMQSPRMHIRSEFRTPHKDGTWRWLEAIAVNMLDDLCIQAIVITSRDVTARKRAEESLRESENRYRQLFESLPIGIGISDMQGRVLSSNPAMQLITGYDSESWNEVKLPDTFKNIDERNKLIDVIQKNGFVREWEARLLRKNGEAYIALLNIDLIELNGEKVFLTNVQDITERKKAEEQLVKTSERLSLATTSGRLGVWDWDLRNNTMVWDDRMIELYGITRNTFPGTIDAWSNGLHTDDRQRATEESNLALAGKKDFNTSFRVVHPDGTVKHIKADGMVIRAPDGSAIRMIGINRDISESVKIDEALRNAQKLESLGILAGGIAHDFNNLLGGIYGYIDLAGESAKSKKVSLYLSKAMNTIERSRGLTRQLLTFAKGGAPVMAIGPLFPHIQETAQFALSGSNAACTFDIAQDLWPCDFDKNQIGQVVDNIIINAVQAMPDGGVITLSAENVTFCKDRHATLGPGDYIRISFTDHGIGIPQEILPRIFDPFYTTKASGHGLGLATCYSIIKRHGGAIDVESEPGKGTAFHVFLPAATGGDVAENGKTAPPFKGKGCFVVMDDEEVMRETIGGMLESLGYSVIYAKDGDEAIDAFSAKAKRQIAGAIFDLTVPGGAGGKEAIVEVRKLYPDIPVFVASGYADDPVMADPTKHGFTASICKPFRKADLAEMLRNYLT
jgi:PAS domain S-box-containing protein